jgi:hypothetical protein
MIRAGGKRSDSIVVQEDLPMGKFLDTEKTVNEGGFSTSVGAQKTKGFSPGNG